MSEPGDLETWLAGERPRLVRYLSATAGAAVAEDLAQETLLRAWQGFDRIREPAARQAWLFRVAGNVAVDRARKARRSPTVPPGAAGAAPGPGPAGRFEQAEMSGCVNDLIARLPAGQQAVVVLHDAHGLTNPEIAERLGCSLAAVKVRLHRGRQRLRELADEACEFSSEEGVLVCRPVDGPIR